jgi:pyruvate-formate lyase-activating enzyme
MKISKNWRKYLRHAFRASSWKNLILSELREFKNFKKLEYVWSLYFAKKPLIPKEVQIEITNACNYDCVMCPRRSMKRKVGLMEFDTYTKIIDECVDCGVRSVKPQFSGESLLHPRVVDMVKYAKDKGLFVYFDTNAALLDEELGERIISSGLDWIILSFHGFSEGQYSKIHGANTFQKVVENIRKFSKLRKVLKSKTPKISLQVTIMDLNYKSVHKVFELFEGVPDEFRISNCQYHPDTMLYDGRLYKCDTKRTEPCLSLLIHLTISWDGKVTFCCVDEDFKLDLGHIDEGLLNIFNSEKANRYRKLHLRGEFEKVPICSNCVDDRKAKSYIPKDIRRKIIEGKV